MKREVIGSGAATGDLSNTMIMATVTVTSDTEEGVGEKEKVELVRYFAGLKPLPGQAVAVPIQTEIEEEPQWYIDLRQKLGREPTVDEALQELVRIGELPQGFMEEMKGTEEDSNQAPEASP